MSEENKSPIHTPNGIALKELPSGSLFSFNGTIALKSEYRSESGAIEAYIVGSGEMFWGGTQTAEALQELIVFPIQTGVEILEYALRDIDLEGDFIDPPSTVKRCAEIARKALSEFSIKHKILNP